MPYVDLAGLSRFAGKSKDFASSACAGPDMANWQKTAAAGAVSFSPVPEMPLDPVVNFLFSETGPASGTKSPDNPSTITGVTQAKVTRCGKNILQPREGIATQTINGVTFTVNGDGTYTVNGTADGHADFYLRFASTGTLLKTGLTYTLSGCPSGGSVETYQFRCHVFSSNVIDTGNGATFTSPATGTVNSYIRIASGTTVSNLVFKPQLELGSVATAFEPYEGADYTLPLGGTFYGGSVDLSTGVMTMTWHGYVFDGTESYWVGPGSAGTYKRYSFTTDKPAPSGSALAPVYSSEICTHFSVNNSVNDGIEHFIVYGNQVAFYAAQTTLTDWKAWLVSQKSAGHPLAVTYPLATPYTVQLDPVSISSLSQPDPYNPRTNTVYSDQVSVQVGYPKSPQATQNELTNAVVSLGGNV